MTVPGGAAPPRAQGARLRIGLGAAVLLLLVGLGCAVLFSAITPRGGSTTVTAGDGFTAAAVGAGATILVHILGAVNQAGLYELCEGDRAVDAVAAAGGFAPDADQSQLNLARPVVDGEQIVVPRIGEVPPGASAGGGAAGGGATGGGSVVPGKVNINTADSTALETLPRVGPALAARIIAWREANGRFTAVEDLMSVSGVGEKTFEGLKDLVTV
jgi:competence protein ComEA